MKHYFVIIEGRGEKEHHSRILVSREDSDNIESELDSICQTWYDSDEEQEYRNYYKCPNCEHEWYEEWTATCDSECPECDTRNISPFDSEEIGDSLPQKIDGCFAFEMGSIFVSVWEYKEIPEEHYEVLKQYLVEL